MTEQNGPKFEALLVYLRDNRGFDFTGYKRSSLQRRIQKRMHMVSIEDYDEYQDYLEVHPGEFEKLFNTILINVTRFFRDKAAWDYLADEIIPSILSGKGPREPVRVWCAGCASGEEAYSIAILLAEAMGEDAFRQSAKIYATDVDEEALTEARHARYTDEDLEPVEENLRRKYFNDDNVFRSDLRRQVIFGRHDLVQDAPISRLDLLSCRNTLMYMNAETQTRILDRFHFALRDTGYLFLGKVEMMLTRTDLFLSKGLEHRVFKKVTHALRVGFETPSRRVEEDKTGLDLSRQAKLWEGALNAIDLAAIIINRDGTLLLSNREMQAMFDIDHREHGRPLQDLEISYRPLELRSLIDQAYESGQPVLTKNVEWYPPSGQQKFLDIRVMPLPLESADFLGAGITFTDVTRFHQMREKLQRANQDLETANEELQSSNEELETTNEELQSTNEELETTNEELQSSNEEMETMNEELQSTNEELEAVNKELRQRSQELNKTNAFLESILASLDAGVIVVDNGMTVIQWNERAEDTWGLRQEEVVGRPFLDLDIGLPVKELGAPLKKSLNSGHISDLNLEAINRRGQTITCNVRSSPLVSAEEEKVGAILLIESSEG